LFSLDYAYFTLIFNRFSPTAGRKLVLIGFVFECSKSRIVAIISFVIRVYVDWLSCKLALFFQITACQIGSGSCHSALDAESSIINKSGFLFSQE
jgi:hypothetical protein